MSEERFKRLMEIIPGGLVWFTLITAVVLSFFAPVIALYFIIVFDLLWLFRIIYFVIFLLTSWRRYRRDIRIDWLAKARELPRFDAIRHLIFMPTYKEGLEIIRPAMKSLAESAYPMREKAIVVFAGEERDKERFLANVEAIKAEFGDRFFRFLVTVHPKDIPGDLPGKGSNIHWAGQRAQELIDELGIPYEDVIVSSFDVDTVAHPQYFACVAYKYLTHPNPTRSSYQPMALYNNNMWDSPAVIRVAAFGTTFWLMTELSRPERLSTFSSHSMPFKALVDVGFWERDIVTEDSRIFLQCLLRYDGEYSVTPIYVPVSMDTVMTDSVWKSMANLYKQQRRWAWGVEHFPYLMARFRGNRRFPLGKKLFHLWTLLEGMYTWATAPILIFMLGYLPLWLAPQSVRIGAFFQNTPPTLEKIMRLSMIGVLTSALMGFALLPPRPEGKRKRDYFVMLLQWILVPVTFIVFGAFPAIDAQTRLMLGRYLGFNVTEKKRKREARS